MLRVRSTAFFLCVAMSSIAWMPSWGGAQELNIVVYNDGSRELQSVYDEYLSEALSDGLSTVDVLSDIAEFSDRLAAGTADVYAAFGSNRPLFDAWTATVPPGKQYVYFSIDAETGEHVSKYHSFSPAGIGDVTAGQWSSYKGSVLLKETQYATQLSSKRGFGAENVPVIVDGQVADHELVGGFTQWIVDGLVKGLQEIIDKVLRKIECIAAWAAGCLDDLLSNLPQDMKIKIVTEGNTTPPGVKVRVEVEGTVAQMRKAARELLKFQRCQAQCVGQCF